jgi:predicted O-methyltransferase YrrM
LEISDCDIANESLDLVFIDGDHSEDAVLRDLHFWFRKVRRGGQILGDDYWMESVSRAVEKFAQETNQSFDFLTKVDSN